MSRARLAFLRLKLVVMCTQAQWLVDGVGENDL